MAQTQGSIWTGQRQPLLMLAQEAHQNYPGTLSAVGPHRTHLPSRTAPHQNQNSRGQRDWLWGKRRLISEKKSEQVRVSVTGIHTGSNSEAALLSAWNHHNTWLNTCQNSARPSCSIISPLCSKDASAGRRKNTDLKGTEPPCIWLLKLLLQQLGTCLTPIKVVTATKKRRSPSSHLASLFSTTYHQGEAACTL